MKIVGLDADVFFGEEDSEWPDWRDNAELMTQDDDPDDEELEETPQDVIAMLGFDPKDL